MTLLQSGEKKCNKSVFREFSSIESHYTYQHGIVLSGFEKSLRLYNQGDASVVPAKVEHATFLSLLLKGYKAFILQIL